MKVIFPKNIKKGLLSGMTFQIGPLNLSIIQLFVLAIGVALSLTIFNSIGKSGSKGLAIILGILIFLLFVVIAFFNVSELNLIPFLSKLIRNRFFDTTKKFQNNYTKNDKIEIKLKELKEEKTKQKIEYKTKEKLNKDRISEIETGGLI